MNLIEILGKRNRNEDLTDEEKELLKQYDESISVTISELDKVKAEKESAETKLNTATSELEEKLRIVTEREKSYQDILEEKNKIQQILDNTKSTEEAKMEIARVTAEKAKQDALKKAEEDKLQALKQIEEDKIAKEKEAEDLKLEVKKLKFKDRLYSERTTKPYLEKQIDSIIANLDTKPIESSEMFLEVVLGMYNHEEEMIKWKQQKESSTSILETKKTEVVETIVPKTEKNEEDAIMAFAKKNGYKVRNK